MEAVDVHVPPGSSHDDGRPGEPAPDPQRFLRLYMRDHDAAAAGGLRFLRRTCASNADTPFGPVLAILRSQVEADAIALKRIAESLDVRRDPVKRTLAHLATAVGGLKPKARMVRYRPLSRVYEFEALTAGVRAKRDLWQSLRLVAQVDTRIDEGEAERLMNRADAQLRTLDDIHARAVRLAFISVS